ncbi:MAG TPA: hypothetical protein VFG87_07710 [Amycolatopsis sp.]|jgi:hypothetical protein|nr:hypothetical protein [Amycolatopsis sp.]
MHPELLSAVAVERCRDLDAMAASRARRTSAARRGHAHSWPALMPKFRVSWTRISLAAVSGRRRRSSVVIVISATRIS